MSQRIKQIRKKTSNGYTTGIPIGTDGILVDMLSGLDLEEELKLGNNHYVQIKDLKETINEQQVTVTEIKEWYLKYPKGNNDISNLPNTNEILYSVKTRIIEDEISRTLYKGDINDNNSLHKDKIIITENNTTIINQEVDSE